MESLQKVKPTRDRLESGEDYVSPERKINPMVKAFPGFFGYAKLADVVFSSAQQAKKGIYDYEHWMGSSIAVLRSLESVGFRFTIENLNIVKKLDSPCVFIGNHMSTLETFILPSLIQPFRDVTFIIKESLIRYPVFKHVMVTRDPIVVGRTNPRQDLKTVLEEGQRRLVNKISVIVFPQTTRRVEFNPKNFNTIGIKLARNADVPVVPVALRSDAWGNGKKIKEVGKLDPSKPVHFCFGEPMIISGDGKAEHQAVVDFIGQKLKTWF